MSEADASARYASHGPNRLPGVPRPGLVQRISRQFHNVLIYVLLASAAIALLVGHSLDALVIVAVVLVNAIIGFVQEGKAERALEAIRSMLAPSAAVLRGGERHVVNADRLVPGDVVMVDAGDRIGADLRLFLSHGLQVQESVLTGESVPVDKDTTPITRSAALGDRGCMAYSGTLVTRGQGMGVVVATGEDTQIGRISGLVEGVETLKTPLLVQIAGFARWITGFILTVAAALLVFGHFVHDYPFVESMMAIVSLSVAAIPEGLPAVISITLAIGVQAMARRNTIVRRLPAIETIGSVSVICTDKTGTLTRNEMMVVRACAGTRCHSVEGTGYQPYGRVDGETGPPGSTALRYLARTAALCNDAVLKEGNDGWTVAGDPMEGALLAFSGKAGVDPRRVAGDWARTDAIPFDAEYRFMATLHHDHHGHALVSVKGAPETLLEMCESQCTDDGGTEPLDVGRWSAQAEATASNGHRVLALAYIPVPAAKTVLGFEDIRSLVFAGLVGLIDPPRAESRDAVAECHAAGIAVKMVTGDHPGTARAIARQVGLKNAERILTGADLDSLDDARLAEHVVDVDVFARTSPEHKLRLVSALQAHGMTVAMTGDGVNDAPALKRADAGIAMGRSGTEVAKESADLVLVDDDFASIVAAVREGRTVYDNIRKVISWTLPTSAGEAATVIAALLAGMALPVTPIQILWVNLVTATTLGVALAFEPTEPNAMRRPPRSRTQPLLGGQLVWHVVLVSILFLFGVYGTFTFALQGGHSEAMARTLAVNALVVMEIFHLFFIRNIYGTSLTWRAVRGTRAVWVTVLAVVAAQLLFTYQPAMQAVFDTEAVGFGDGLLVIGVGVLLFIVVETEKQIRLRL